MVVFDSNLKHTTTNWLEMKSIVSKDIVLFTQRDYKTTEINMRKFDLTSPTPRVLRSFKNVEPLIVRQKEGWPFMIRAAFTTKQEKLMKFFIDDSQSE